ncbi:T9SS type A sorting domain-containing protein [Chryseobacterium sp. Marseille-Q3244]|nr:T9SS type A sorting domain-containing protein [Chryseobacterium sp. Marseille-Q3244]
MRFDGYLQRVNADGTLPWGVSGVDFDTNQTYFEKDMKVAFESGSPYIWSIANYSSSSQGENGEFVQKFDKNTGARLFTDNAKQVFPVDNTSMFHYSNLQLVNDKPYFVVQKKEGTSLNVSLNAVLLKDSGDFEWSQHYLPIATFPASKGYTTVLKPINGQGVIVFQETKNTEEAPTGIYAQNLILPNGTMGTNDISGKKINSKLYPNPATDIIHIDGLKDQDFKIYNTVGQLIKTGLMKQGMVDISDLIRGAYIIKVKEENMKFIKK